jgi:hypothetical protein
MDDVSFLRQRIESYADYTNRADRLRSDEEVRAYVGEALARLGERLRPAGAAGETLGNALLRCEFADQSLARTLDADDVGEPEILALRAADRELVALADRADAVDAAEVQAYVTAVDDALQRRSRIAPISIAKSQPSR